MNDQLYRARRYVDDGRQIVTRQERRIAVLKAKGHDTLDDSIL